MLHQSQKRNMNKTGNTFGVRKSQRLLLEWDKAFAHRNASSVLDGWASQLFARSFRSLSNDTTVHRALLQSFVSEIAPFDCFLIAGWEPTENPLSDAIAALFDSNWGHPFAQRILHHTLGAVASNGSFSRAQADKIRHVQESFAFIRPQIFVSREQRGDSSRADIDVYSPGSDGFLVRIEHKVRDGSETTIAGKDQTLRLWEDAIKRAGQLGIDREYVFNIFLSPGGDPAAYSEFGVLSFHELSDAVRAAVIDISPEAKTISGAAASILGFMGFYRRM
jgi:hypothetical protein